MKNAIVVIAIGIPEIIETTLVSFEAYAKKTKSDLIIIDKPIYNIAGTFKYNYMRFEKNQIYNVLSDYDRVLRLDADIVINPATPNLFLFDKKNIYAVKEDINYLRSIHTKIEIKKIQKDLGDINGWKDTYYNGGVILASKKHREVFNISDIDFSLDLGLLKEQNVFNWRAKKLKFHIEDLGPNFNFYGGMNPSNFYLDSSRRQAYFIHHTVQGWAKKQAGLAKDIEHFFSKNDLI